MDVSIAFGARQRFILWLGLVLGLGLLWTTGGIVRAQEPPPRVGTPGHMSHTPPGASAMANAMNIPASQVVAATLGTSDPQGTDVFSSPLAGFPTLSNNYAVISSGHAPDTFLPNNDTGLSTILAGLNNSQGNDLVQLTLTLAPAPGATHWAVDWRFFSEEFPEFVGTQFNDAFLIETDRTGSGGPISTFVINPDNTINAPNNVAFDPSGNPVTINTTGAVGMTAANSLGTTYDGATATLTTVGFIPVASATITIIFSVMDLGDSIFDTTVFLDNFRFVVPNVPPPTTAKTVRIPIRWCAVQGAPSQLNPGLVGETNLKGVLWRRHERVTDNIYLPQAGITLRSGTTASLPSFPVIADVNSTGSPGDIIDPRFDGGIEHRDAINRCRAAWRASAPTVTGLTAIHINRFVNSAGTRTGLGGLGGLPVQSNGASQIAYGDAMVIDSAYGLSVSPIRIYGPDDVDKLLGHELGHAVSLWHGNGVDDDGNGIIDGPPHLTEPDTTNGPNLMQYQFSPPGTIITGGQAGRMRSQALLHIPDREVDPEPLPLGNTGVDALGDTPAGMEFADINEFGAAVDPDGGLTYFFTSFNGQLPENISGLTVYFLVDTDNNAATGGDPSSVGAPSSAGIDLVINVDVSVVAGVASAADEIFQFDVDTNQFIGITNGVFSEVTTQILQLIDIFDVDGAEQPLPVANGVQVAIPTDAIVPLGMTPGLEVHTESSNPGLIDSAGVSLDFGLPSFPSCIVTPGVASAGDTVSVTSFDLPPSAPVHAFLGANEVFAGGTTDPIGSIAFSFGIPGGESPGGHVVTVGIDDLDTAITADCEVFVDNPPVFDSPPTPPAGTEFNVQAAQTLIINVQASDPDSGDVVALDFVNPDAATLTCDDPGNPTACVFEWTPDNADIGVHVVPFIAIDSFGLSDSLSIVIVVTQGDDTTPPLCEVQGVNIAHPAPPSNVLVHVQDLGSGLSSVNILTQENVGEVTFTPAIAAGTTELIEIVADKADEGSLARFQIEVFDVAGNRSECDPLLAVLNRSPSSPRYSTYDAIPQQDRYFTISNTGESLMTYALVNVNDKWFVMPTLQPYEIKTIDIRSAMVAGDDNTVTVWGGGHGSVVMISDVMPTRTNTFSYPDEPLY